MDWWSRYVLAWRLSNTLEVGFCVDAWQEALGEGRRIPDISNTAQAYVNAVEESGAQVSMVSPA